MKRYVCGFLFSKDRKEICLIMKNKPEWQKDKLNGVGGKIEVMESVHDAMIREFEEETGVYLQHWDHYVTLNGEGYECNFLRAFGDEIDSVLTKEEEEIMVINVEGLDCFDHIPNLRWLIPLALDKTIKHVTVQDTGN